jgi:hypothetical protein
MGNVVLSCSTPPPLLPSESPPSTRAAAGGAGGAPPQQVTPQPARAGPSKTGAAGAAAVPAVAAVAAAPPPAAGPRRGVAEGEASALLGRGEGEGQARARSAPSASPTCGARGESFRRRLNDMRRQYSWSEIPFEFFVDAQVTVESTVSPSHIARCVRERSSARKAERARGPCGVEQTRAPPSPCFAVPA